MGKSKKIFGSIILGFVTVSLLSCSPASTSTPTPIVKDTPKPTKSVPSPSPTTVREPVKAEHVVLAWNEIRLLDGDDNVLDQIDYKATPQQFIDFITPVYGTEPDKEYVNEGDVCWTDITTVTWDNLNFYFVGEDYDNGTLLWFSANTDEKTHGIPVTAPNGLQPGDSYSSSLEQEPNQYFYSIFDYEGTEYVSWLTDRDPSLNPQTEEEQYNSHLVGTVIHGMDGTISSISSPQYLLGDC